VRIWRNSWLPAWQRRSENQIGQSSRAGMLHDRLLAISTPGQRHYEH
jgi:hypothetical protein